MTVARTWTGLTQDYQGHLTEQEARTYAARWLRELRHDGESVTTTEPGREWRITCAADRLRILDCDDPHAPTCAECGCESVYNGRSYTCC